MSDSLDKPTDERESIIQAYDPRAETEKHRRRLPHWTQEGATYWVTFRLADALPQEKLRAWQAERDIWMKHHPKPWTMLQWNEYEERFGHRLEEWLNSGYGECQLARPDARQLLENSLLHFDGLRYDVYGCVIMPNHVHLLVCPYLNEVISDIMKGIKGVSARKINTLLARSNSLWFDESFDHIVRNESQFHHFRQYIAENPSKAGLAPDTFWLYLPSVEQTLLSANSGDNSVPDA